jgi:hypothetical protein
MRGEIRALAAFAGEEAAMAEVRVGTVVEMKQTVMRQPIRTCFDNGWALVEGQIGVLVARETCSCAQCGNGNGIWHKILVGEQLVWSRRRHFRILLQGGEHG